MPTSPPNELNKLIEQQRNVITKLQKEILQSPTYEPGHMGAAIEAHINGLRALENKDRTGRSSLG